VPARAASLAQSCQSLQVNRESLIHQTISQAPQFFVSPLSHVLDASCSLSALFNPARTIPHSSIHVCHSDPKGKNPAFRRCLRFLTFDALVPHMLYRHRFDLQHQVRSCSFQPPRKVTGLLLRMENILLLDLPPKPLLALPNQLLCHLSTSTTLEKRALQSIRSALLSAMLRCPSRRESLLQATYRHPRTRHL
jgi:hypothetical protein